MADDNLPYATINYASGPGAQLNMIQGNRQNLNKLDMDNKVSLNKFAIGRFILY